MKRGLGLLCLSVCCLLAAPVLALAKPPNIILIVADDQAFCDFGFMGHPVIRTPNIDRLAEQSARFPNGYVPMSLCRPSLVTLLTGLYPHQHKVHFNDPPRGTDRRLAEHFIREVPTLPRILAGAGYRTLQTGKFWEGHYSNAGFTDGMTHGDPDRVDRHPKLGQLRGRHGDLGLTIGRDGMEPIFDFIRSVGDKPFFVWYAPFLPHTPYTPPQKHLAIYQEGKDLPPRVAEYYAMCSWFDETVGQLMEHLEQRKLVESTLVLFVVDNGWIPNTKPDGPPFAPRSKQSPYEKGIRTPILVRWPGRFQPATHADLVSSVDIVPTALAAARLGHEVQRLPGQDLLPVCEGKTAAVDRAAVFGDLYAHDARSLGSPARDLRYRWVRSGAWKLVDAADPNEPDLLFNLIRDPDEQSNLFAAADYQAKRTELLRLLDQWWTP